MVTLFVLWGLAVGGAYFALLMRSARQLGQGDIRVAGALGAFGLRLALFVPGAAVATRVSLVALGTYMLGFIAARFALVHLAHVRGMS